MGIGMFFSILFGYLYEIWARKSVLTLAFVLLAIGMIIPESGLMEESDTLYSIGRITTCVLA